MNQYHKINTIFKRDEKTKHIIEGDYSLPEFEYLKDNKWVFTEKVDGTNIRVMWNGESVVFGGKTDDAQMPVFLLYKLQELFEGTQKRLLFKEKFGAEPVCLYGEGYGAKIQKGGGNYNPSGVDFVLFDVLISDVAYDNINICPIHKHLVNATQKDLILLRDFVNPAIISFLKRKILNGQKTLKDEWQNTDKVKKENSKLANQQENAILNQNSELELKNTTDYQESKMDFVQSVEKNKNGMEEMENSFPLSLTTAIKRAELEDCFVALATLQFIKQNEMMSGSQKQFCICERKKTEWYLQREDVEDIAKHFGIKVVPIIGEGTLAEAIEKVRNGFNSQWGEFLAEGIVARPKTELKARNGERIITKIKHRDF
jgi:hypothetical protein